MTTNPLDSLRMEVTTWSGDWSTSTTLAWVYGIICGWDEASLQEFRLKYGWTKETTDRLKELHQRYEELRETRTD